METLETIMTRNGKIARLPRPLRDELNQRLSANEEGAALLDWLNAAPDVKAVLARDFAGEPVSKQNLYEWHHGGFVEWQSRQDLFAGAALESNSAPPALSATTPMAESPANSAARTSADINVICVPASLPLNQDLATSCPPEMRPVVPQPGFGSNQVKPNPLNSVLGKTR